MDRSSQIDTFSRFPQVSRETITSLIRYEDLLIQANRNLNLIGKSTINDVWARHFMDSIQVIDFIEENDKTMIDMGSGAGFPGIVLAIASKDRKIPIKIKLLEKSIKKARFLNEIVKELSLNVEVINKNFLNLQNKISEDVLVARAFKPLKIFLPLIHKNTEKWKKIIIFLGKTGNDELHHASKSWDIKYKQRVSITSSDSSIIEITNLKKKF